MSSSLPTPDVAATCDQGKGRLVLVVEDNEKNARLTIAMLEAAGYLTCLAGDGIAGLQIALSRSPDLVVTDLQMPGMDGLAMTRALREHPEMRTVPILAISAHALQEHRDQAIAAGCRGFLTKPFRFRELLAAVDTAMAPTPVTTSANTNRILGSPNSGAAT